MQSLYTNFTQILHKPNTPYTNLIQTLHNHYTILVQPHTILIQTLNLIQNETSYKPDTKLSMPSCFIVKHKTK